MGLWPDGDDAVQVALDAAAADTQNLLERARAAFGTSDARVSADEVVEACLNIAEALEHLRFHLIIDDLGGDSS